MTVGELIAPAVARREEIIIWKGNTFYRYYGTVGVAPWRISYGNETTETYPAFALPKSIADSEVAKYEPVEFEQYGGGKILVVTVA